MQLYIKQYELYVYLEDDQQDHDQMPVAKKYEMLGDRDATKLKLELEGGTGEKHHRGGKKNLANAGTIANKANTADTADTADTTITADDKEQEEEIKAKKEEEEIKVKKDEEMDTSDIIATGEESTAEDTAADQSIKEENINNESATNKENQPAAYDPKVAIGKKKNLMQNYMHIKLLFNNNNYFIHIIIILFCINMN